MSRSRVLLPIALSCLGVVLSVTGILGDELPMILRKAIYICLECIGIG
jgi:hypothetical protein